MVEKPSLAVQLSDREPTVDTQGVEVYNEEGIEYQLMGKKTGPGEPNGSLGPVFVWEFLTFWTGQTAFAVLFQTGFACGFQPQNDSQ